VATNVSVDFAAGLAPLVECCGQIYTRAYMDEGRRVRALLLYHHLADILPPPPLVRLR
jgi:hypothetical protein